MSALWADVVADGVMVASVYFLALWLRKSKLDKF